MICSASITRIAVSNSSYVHSNIFMLLQMLSKSRETLESLVYANTHLVRKVGCIKQCLLLIALPIGFLPEQDKSSMRFSEVLVVAPKRWTGSLSLVPTALFATLKSTHLAFFGDPSGFLPRCTMVVFSLQP